MSDNFSFCACLPADLPLYMSPCWVRGFFAAVFPGWERMEVLQALLVLGTFAAVSVAIVLPLFTHAEERRRNLLIKQSRWIGLRRLLIADSSEVLLDIGERMGHWQEIQFQSEPVSDWYAFGFFNGAPDSFVTVLLRGDDVPAEVMQPLAEAHGKCEKLRQWINATVDYQVRIHRHEAVARGPDGLLEEDQRQAAKVVGVFKEAQDSIYSLNEALSKNKGIS